MSLFSDAPSLSEVDKSLPSTGAGGRGCQKLEKWELTWAGPEETSFGLPGKRGRGKGAGVDGTRAWPREQQGSVPPKRRPLHKGEGWRAEAECCVRGGFRALDSSEAEPWFEQFPGFLQRKGALSTHSHT